MPTTFSRYQPYGGRSRTLLTTYQGHSLAQPSRVGLRKPPGGWEGHVTSSRVYAITENFIRVCPKRFQLIPALFVSSPSFLVPCDWSSQFWGDANFQIEGPIIYEKILQSVCLNNFLEHPILLSCTQMLWYYIFSNIIHSNVLFKTSLQDTYFRYLSRRLFKTL